MEMEEKIEMTNRDIKRSHIVNQVNEKKLTQKKAGEMLNRSVRQIRRLVNCLQERGKMGLIHGLRGRGSNRKHPDKLKRKVIRLYERKYHDFGPTLASEKLDDLDGIKIGRETLREWLKAEDLWKPKRKGRKHRHWRERKAYRGEMLQLDGSHHDWFEGRGEWCVLMAYIDDASSDVYARFYEYEGTIPAMDSLKGYIQQNGIPGSIYLDKHTTYKSNGKPSIEDELNNRKPLSQFERALKELGIQVIHAHSPQAKGRIERLFKTFQDRVIKEMRLQKIRNIQAANVFLFTYLKTYNQRYSVIPREPADLHQPIPKGMNVDQILSIREERVVRNDFTISYENDLYQILEPTKSKRVLVEKRLNGQIIIRNTRRNLNYKKINERPVKRHQLPLAHVYTKHTPRKVSPIRQKTYSSAHGYGV